MGRTCRVTTCPKSSDLKVGQSKSGGVSLDKGSRDCLFFQDEKNNCTLLVHCCKDPLGYGK